MTNRREFLQTGVAVTAWSLATSELPASGAVQSSSVSLHGVVYDPRYDEARAFAAGAALRGARACAIENGDVTDLWYRDLDLVWRSRPAALAGISQFGPLFALERLASERGLSVRLRVEHRPTGGGALEHALSAPSESIALAERLLAQRVDWPTAMAMLVTAVRADAAHDPLEERTLVTPGEAPLLRRVPGASAPESVIHYYTPVAVQEGRGPALDGPLFTWLIAPARGRRA
jgi:hypothetical protein